MQHKTFKITNTQSPPRPKRHGDEDKFLAHLQARLLSSIRSDIAAIKEQARKTVASPSYWIRLKPFISLLIGASATSALGFYGTNRYLIYRKRKHQNVLNIFRRRDDLPHRKKRAKARKNNAALNAILNPVLRHVVGLATTSAFTYFLGKAKIKRNLQQKYQADTAGI